MEWETYNIQYAHVQGINGGIATAIALRGLQFLSILGLVRELVL